MTLENIAQIVHEINKAFCESLGDTSLVSWADTPQDIKAIVVDGVLFHLNNPNAGADASHNNWMANKIAQGWVYGPVKDATKKEHPSIIPFEKLSLTERQKDVLVMQTVHSLAPHFSNPFIGISNNLPDLLAEIKAKKQDLKHK
jgi:hypothetical protein